MLTSWVGEEPPYLYTDISTGEVVGPDAEVLRAAAASVGCRVEFLSLPWKRAIQALKTGDLDVVPYAKFTTDRALFARYSRPYRDFVHQLYVPSETPSGARTLSGLIASGGRVGVMRGYRYPLGIEQIIRDPSYQSQVVFVSEYDQLLHLAHKGRIHGIIASDDVITTRCAALGYDTSFFDAGQGFPEHLHFIFSRQTVSETQMRDLKMALQVALDSGDFEELY